MLHSHHHHKKDKASKAHYNGAAKEEKEYPKETVEFHKRFDVPRSETVVTYFSCAHKGKFLKQGKMYITQGYIGFHAQLFGKQHKKLVAFADISAIAKDHYGMLPNAIKVTTLKNKEMLFASFVHREAAFEALLKQWTMAKEKFSNAHGSDDDDDHHYAKVGDKKELEMKKLSPKTDETQYKNYDVTKKKLPPSSTAHEHDGAEGPKASLGDRAAALVESGAIVTDEKLTAQSRPSSQQVMVPADNQLNQSSQSTATTTTTIEVEPVKKRYLCCWL